MKPYPAYKDGGVEWLGQVPAHWVIKRLGSSFLERKEKVSDKDYPALSVTMGGIVPQIDTAAKTDDGDNRKLVRSGDFVINSRSDRKGSSGLSELDGSVSLISIVLKPAGDVGGKFSHWLLKSRNFQEEFYRWGTGIVADLWSTRYADMRTITLALPPLPEQQAIAAFLDRETAKIDGLIEEQRRLIALLAEKRQATISHAVTRGLNPSARLKPSGVDWLGDIPEGWEVVRIKTLAEIISKGTTPTTMGFNFEDGGVRFLKAENITLDGRVEPEPEFYISEDADLALSRSRLHARDVLVVIAGATTGKSAILEGDLLPANTNQAVAFIRCRHKDDADWIQRWLSTQSIQNLISLGSVQSAQPNLSMEDLGNLPLLLPPPKESSKILDECGHSISQLDALTETAATAIALLQERRAALISAAGTGRIDVRGLASAEDAA